MFNGAKEKHLSRLWLIADSITSAIDQAVDHFTRPKPDSTVELLQTALPMMEIVLQALAPKKPVDTDGPRMKQVRREFAAEEARLAAEHAGRRSRLVAHFGPVFDKALAADEAVLFSDFKAEEPTKEHEAPTA